MSEIKYEYKQLNITELLLNPMNPRFDPVKHQTEVIAAMIEDQQDKLLSLAKHISDFGLNPTDIILIQSLGSQWLVREGNRRITALKLMNEPDLIPDGYPKLKREFQKLNAILESELVGNIPCVIISDEALANEWIRLKHTGENKGSGTVGWDGQQTSRFSLQVSGKPDIRIVFLDYLRALPEIPIEFKERFSEIKKTNFDRLMGDPDVRALLGVSNEGGNLTLIDGVNEYLIAALYDLAFDDLRVGSIYYKEDRKKYIESLRARVQKGDSIFDAMSIDSEATPTANSEDSDTINSHDNPHSISDSSLPDTSEPSMNHNTNNRGQSYPINRKTLVPAQHRLTITHARITKIFNELKRIDVNDYPNAVAVLFRVFIELSADCYISAKGLTSVNVDSKLSAKIEAVASDLERNAIMTNHELRSARQMASSQTQNNSVKTFHAYVHNKDITPLSADVKTAWDDLWPFIENIWR